MTYLPIVLAVVLPAIVSIAVFYFWAPIAGRMQRQRNTANIKRSPEIRQDHGCFDCIIAPGGGMTLMGPCFRDGHSDDRICFTSMETGSRIWLNGAEVEQYVFPTMPHPKDNNKRLYMFSEVDAAAMKAYLHKRFEITDSIFGKYTPRKLPTPRGKK